MFLVLGTNRNIASPLVLTSLLLSRRQELPDPNHCHILCKDGGHWIQDQGSTHGTYLFLGDSHHSRHEYMVSDFGCKLEETECWNKKKLRGTEKTLTENVYEMLC